MAPLWFAATWLGLGAIGGAIVFYDVRRTFAKNQKHSEASKLVAAFVIQAMVIPLGPVGLAFAIHFVLNPHEL